MDRKNLREHVRDLITLPINQSPVISCYQALSNGKLQDPNLYVQQMRSLRLGAGRSAWPEFDEGLSRIQQYISGRLYADAKGLAAFARGGEAPFFLPLQFRVALPNWISADTTPNIYHLVSYSLRNIDHRPCGHAIVAAASTTSRPVRKPATRVEQPPFGNPTPESRLYALRRNKTADWSSSPKATSSCTQAGSAACSAIAMPTTSHDDRVTLWNAIGTKTDRGSYESPGRH